jgi:hypothetical protein
MIGEMTTRLCPRCGAYWECDCKFDEVRMDSRIWDELTQPSDDGCPHDWTVAVGVTLDIESEASEARVLVCRLCGLYAVQKQQI